MGHTMVRRTIFVLMGLWLALTPARIGAQEQLATPVAATPVAAAAVTATAMFRGNAARTGEQPGPGPVGEPVLRWRFHAGDIVTSSPAVSNGVVYVGSGSYEAQTGTLFAIDAATGTERWRVDLSGFVTSSPAVANSVVYVGGIDGTFVALDAATGAERWRTTLGRSVRSSPAIVDDVVYHSRVRTAVSSHWMP